jgi:hypothetical protein
MRYICPECGNEIPEDQVFCYSCGRKRDNTIRLDEKGNFVQSEEDRCASCDGEMQPDDPFCRSCSQPISRTQLAAFKPKMTKNGWIGLSLALIPGALGFVPIEIFGIWMFGIYGLGHFYFKKWKRGVMFLMITGMLFYLKNISPNSSLIMTLMVMMMVVFIFVLQAAEVFVLAHMPAKTKEGPK